MTRRLDKLDPSVAFVRAVERVQRGEAELDHPAAILRGFQERHGVYILRSQGPRASLGRATGLRLPEAPALRSSALLARLREAPAGPAALPGYGPLHDGLQRQARERLFPFLSDTLLLIEGAAFADRHLLLITEPGVHDPRVECFCGDWSPRAWGQLMADWAAWAGWTHASGRALSYVDFYIGGAGGLANYYTFMRVALEAIELATRELLAELSLPPSLTAG